jgi:hypothetical protein
MRLCPICNDLGFYPIFDMDGEQRYSIDCPDCGGARVEERGGTNSDETAVKAGEESR